MARGDERIGSTIPMPTMSSFLRVDIPQSSMVGQQRQQISELQFDKFPTPSSFFMLEDMIPKRGDYLIFPRKQCYGSTKWRRSSHWMN